MHFSSAGTLVDGLLSVDLLYWDQSDFRPVVYFGLLPLSVPQQWKDLSKMTYETSDVKLC